MIRFGVRKFFLLLVLSELVLLGSGRPLELGGVTLRMVIFVTMFTGSMILLFWRGKNDGAWPAQVVLVFAFFMIFPVFISVARGVNFAAIWADVSPLLYWLMVVPFYFLIKDESDVVFSLSVLVSTSILMACAYLVLLTLHYFSFFEPCETYFFLSGISGDFIFRGTGCDWSAMFYKGFLYLNIALIALFWRGVTPFRSLAAALLLIAIVLSGTRGFLVSLFVVGAVFVMFWLAANKFFGSVMFFGLISAAGVLTLMSQLVDFDSISDSVRLAQMSQVFERVNATSFLFGHGYGVGVPVRPVHMEISFLEVFHKQGIFGLFAYLLILGYAAFLAWRAWQRGLAMVLFGGVLFVFVQSLFNPFVNNSIGIGFIVFSLASLRVLSKEQDVRGTDKSIWGD